MLASVATLNSGPLATIVPSTTILSRLQRPQLVASWPSPPRPLPKSSIISTTVSVWETATSVKTAVAAVDSSGPSEKQKATTKYYFVVANAKFMLDEEEHFQELMFERLRLFGERNKEQDFWLVIEPKFLNKFPKITGRLKRPAVALVSTNGTWITFMKLRLDRVLSESYEADTLEEALASNPVNLEFEKPENWVAPYSKYEFGWWEPFLPPGSVKPKA
ncbi:Ycf54-like protein [Actinidia chinensis var. chinensis]|uniref:Ycf54-like protein n=1 Tax=Actinidia chinensis var. chinensis TaxID=1590841 RepID=A0A2R6QSS1_ACTCC|nr:Ycf54-like protein [Actinidia chinensis var. chinensis]